MATTKFSLNDKNYNLPDADGYIPVGEKTSVGNPATPVYMTNGKLKPITSYSGNAYTATKLKSDRLILGDAYLIGTENDQNEAKHLKTLPSIKITVAGPSNDPYKQTLLTLGHDARNQGAIRMYDGSRNNYFATIFAANFSDYREYLLPDRDGEFAVISEGNDLVEFRVGQGSILPGRVVQEAGDGTLKIASERLARGCEIVSDTYSLAIGKDDTADLPIALTGRVLAYPDKDASTFEIGAPVCAGENGTVSQMTEEEERMYPSRILGTVSEIPTYGVWSEGNKNIPVNGRIWIRVR